jgi:hypothetical protein
MRIETNGLGDPAFSSGRGASLEAGPGSSLPNNEFYGDGGTVCKDRVVL